MITVPQLDPVSQIQATDVIMITHADGTTEKITGKDFIDSIAPNISQSQSIFLHAYSSSIESGEIHELGRYIIPDNGVYSIDWCCYCINNTQGGTSIGIRIVKETNGNEIVLDSASLFMGVVAWNNALSCHSTYKLLKDDIIKFYYMCANPSECANSNPNITKII